MHKINTYEIIQSSGWTTSGPIWFKHSWCGHLFNVATFHSEAFLTFKQDKATFRGKINPFPLKNMTIP